MENSLPNGDTPPRRAANGVNATSRDQAHLRVRDTKVFPATSTRSPIHCDKLVKSRGTRSRAQVPVRGLSFRGVRARALCADAIPHAGAPTSLGPSPRHSCSALLPAKLPPRCLAARPREEFTSGLVSTFATRTNSCQLLTPANRGAGSKSVFSDFSTAAGSVCIKPIAAQPVP
jgi:hypothetical protein